ncbi:MAG: M48 family metalloprotease [Planctomycetota bacterium]|nr:M48 family metalloprotease [Planctomycetota bacterium]
MGYLLNILFALGALAAVDLGPAPPVELPVAVPALCLAPYVLALVVRRLSIAGHFRIAALVGGALLFSAPILLLVAVMVLGWAQAVEGYLGVRMSLMGWPGPELFLGLLPYCVFELCAIDARARSFDLRRDAVRSMRSFQTRMYLSALAPLFIYIAISTLVGLNRTVRTHFEELAILNALFATLLLTLFAFSLPTILRNTWETAPIEPGWARSLLEEVARSAGFRCKDLYVWRTGNLVANAAIVGFTPRQRIVLFSDALLAQLGPRQLAAVFSHEIGHALRHHALIFGCWAIGFFLWADLLLGWLELGSATIELAVFAGMLGIWYLAFGYLSRRFELDADLTSIELVNDPEALIDALEQVGGMHSRKKSSWRHFSTEERVKVIEGFVLDPRRGKRLRAKLRAWTFVGLALLAIALGLELYRLVGSVDRDRVVIDLRLGRYDELAARIARITRTKGDDHDFDEDLLALARRAAGLDRGDRSFERLEELTRSALWRGDSDAASDYVALALLRGHAELDPVSAALELVAQGERNTALDLLRERAPDWENAFRVLFQQAPGGS